MQHLNDIKPYRITIPNFLALCLVLLLYHNDSTFYKIISF